MIVATLKDLEQRLDIECEKNALLESEVVEKQTMAITVQRLKDEARGILCFKCFRIFYTKSLKIKSLHTKIHL